MNNDQLDPQIDEIDEIERVLLRDDPALARRLRKLDQTDMRHDAVVFSLLAASALLLAVGVATLSPAAWLAGACAYFSSFAVDIGHERKLQQLVHVETTKTAHKSIR
jgi:hypothetical protein